MAQGYEYFTDENSGQRGAIERTTGEVLSTHLVEVPSGTIFYTPEQQRAYKARKKAETEKELRRICNKPLGNFFFVLSQEQFDGIVPETVTRLIYLNTFLCYEDNRLMITQRTPMKRKDLSAVLKLSKATVSRFWNEVSSKYITEDESGLIFTNGSIFQKGNIKKTPEHYRYLKCYVTSIRKLYLSTISRNHRQLGYLFKLLPFINVEYNLICNNPLESELDKLELLSVADFCRLIGYDIAHINKLLDIYQSIYFDVNGTQERFCAITYDGINKAGAKICINPHILYSGGNYQQVKILGAFCK